jgi:branched-chain amino acid transport system substrate-binding protein
MHRIRWSRLAVAATSALLAAGFVGAAASAQPSGNQAATRKAADPVKVGIIYSRTGLLSAYGAQYIQGLKLGLEYATKGTGKVNGRKIEITAVDDGTDPAKAVTAAKDLIGRGYKIIGGSVSSGVALQIAPLAEQNRVLNISGPAATDLITGANRYTFRSGRQSIQDTLAIKEILGKGVGKKIVVVAQDSAFGQGNVAAVATP